jgi:hypothetical protein
LPVVGQQLVEILVLDGLNPLECVLEPLELINPVLFTGGYKGVHGRRHFGRLVGAGEQVVLPADGDGADTVLGQVVVDLDLPVQGIGAQALPAGQGVGQGLAQRAFGQLLRQLQEHPLL